MSKIKIKMFCKHRLTSLDYAKAFYEALNTWAYPPTAYSKYEPIQQDWGDRGGFEQAWEEEGSRSFGQVLVRRRQKPMYYADSLFKFGPNRKADNKPPYHGVSLYRISKDQLGKDGLTNLIQLADRLFSNLEMDYGFVCVDDEYDEQNVIKNFRHDDGSLEPRHIVGMKWPYCLPGLYWINYFGQAYLAKGFAASVDSEVSDGMTRLENGVRVQLGPDPLYFQSEAGQSRRAVYRHSLGEDWFYSGVDSECTPLDVELEALRTV